LKDDLIQSVVELGVKTGQFLASRGKDTDVGIERKIVDAEYYKVVGQDKIRKTYRAYMLFDESTLEAKYSEEITEASSNLSLGTGGMAVGTSKSFFKCKTLGYKEFGKTWAMKKDDLTPGKVVDYSLDVNKIRDPIERMLPQNGWKLVLVTTRKDASYKKKSWFG
jgi:hypothetical protein